MGGGFDKDDVAYAGLLFLIVGVMVLLGLASNYLPRYLEARCIADSGSAVVTKAEEVYRLEVYDGTEKKVVYVSRDDWERAGMGDSASTSDAAQQGASDAAVLAAESDSKGQEGAGTAVG